MNYSVMSTVELSLSPVINVKAIAWKCRRGMLELDILLQKFFEQHFSDLSTQEQQFFNSLLDEDDPLLASWLFGSEQPNDPNFASLISKIKPIEQQN